MNPTTHFAFADFARAIENLENAFRNEPDRYLLLTGETGVGKTMLCRQLHTVLDRCRYRVLYFSHARHLSATGLIRVLAGCLRLPTRRSHSETLQGLVHSLREQPHQLLIWFDEAHELADETLLEARSLAESDLADNWPKVIWQTIALYASCSSECLHCVTDFRASLRCGGVSSYAKNLRGWHLTN
jgi:type II secretory pathway predicted ATPase ExeA